MSWIGVAILGGVTGADATSVAQSMLSRPLVSGALTGWLLGRPIEGVVIGMILEAFALVILPIGAARYPESGTAAIAAVAAYAAVAGPAFEPVLILTAVAFGLGWEWVGGRSVIWLRRLNARVVDVPLTESRRPDMLIVRRHLLGLALDFARGAAVALVGALIGTWLLRVLGPRTALDPGAAFGVLALAGTMMIAAALPLFGGWAGRRLLFVLGLLCGSVLLLLQ